MPDSEKSNQLVSIHRERQTDVSVATVDDMQRGVTSKKGDVSHDCLVMRNSSRMPLTTCEKQDP